MRLPQNASSGRTTVEYEKRYVLHAEAPVYYPAPDGATYTNSATCKHDHPDTDKGREATEECAARLARIIGSGRLPDWATLTYPLPRED
jgi:hypothetical protein